MQIRLTTDPTLSRKTSRKGKGKETTAPRDAVQSPFQAILEEVLPPENDSDLDLHKLWGRLPEAENDLIESTTDENLNTYREIIRGILGATLKRNARVKKMVRRSRRGDELELNVVEFVDERLQKMIYAIRSRENTAFQIFRGIEEIRGILLDIR